MRSFTDLHLTRTRFWIQEFSRTPRTFKQFYFVEAAGGSLDLITGTGLLRQVRRGAESTSRAWRDGVSGSNDVNVGGGRAAGKGGF